MTFLTDSGIVESVSMGNPAPEGVSRKMRTTFSWHGHERTLSVPDDLAAEVTALPARLQYLVGNGWNQALLDSYASAKDEADFEGRLFKKYDAIIAGTVRSSDGTGTARVTDPVEKEFNRLVRDKLSAWAKERKAAGKPKPSDELSQVWLERYIELHGPSLRAIAEENISRSRSVAVDGLDDLLEGLE